MPKFVIERELPGAGQLTADQIQGVAQKSNEVLDSLGGRAQWLQSYVTDDKLFCVYIADDPATIKEHAAAGGFPCNEIREVRTIIDPTTVGIASSKQRGYSYRAVTFALSLPALRSSRSAKASRRAM